MELTLIIVLVVALILVLGVILMFTIGRPDGGSGSSSQVAVSDSLRSLVASQREKGHPRESRQKASLAVAAAAENADVRMTAARHGRITLAKRLRYATWTITPVQFRALQVLSMIVLAIFAYAFNAVQILLMGVITGYVFWEWSLQYAQNKRFKAFDCDYPVLLLSYVSLLKTGMSTIVGLEAAAKGLAEDSLVRREVEILIERLRLGLTEEQAINAFGEDVPHPELELFVQSLLLSKRVGGTLSATLERLARQVRKRQQFREQAISAVGLERGSMYAVAMIMSGLMLYLLWMQPDLLLPALSHPQGRGLFLWGLCAVYIGFLWSRTVTNIKV